MEHLIALNKRLIKELSEARKANKKFAEEREMFQVKYQTFEVLYEEKAHQLAQCELQRDQVHRELIRVQERLEDAKKDKRTLKKEKAQWTQIVFMKDQEYADNRKSHEREMEKLREEMESQERKMEMLREETADTKRRFERLEAQSQNETGPLSATHVLCQICNFKFCDFPGRVPRLLECGHTLCEGCAEQLAKESTDYGFNIKCPFDRKIMYSVADNVKKLPRNYAILAEVED